MWTIEKDEWFCVEDTCPNGADISVSRLCPTHRAAYDPGFDVVGIDWAGDLYCIGCALDNGYIACEDVTLLDQVDRYAVCSSCRDFIGDVPL
jgi:hypothetical protein